MKQISQLS